jgi:hypothetical protein
MNSWDTNRIDVPNKTEIEAFWAWFATVASTLAMNFEDEALQACLTSRLEQLGSFGWEIGPGRMADNCLAISPDGDVEKLESTRRIVAHAPHVPNWEFLAARPSRTEAISFVISTDAGDELQVDAHDWSYVLYRTPRPQFDISIEQANLANASADERYVAAVVVLDALLGEERRLTRIADVVPVVEQGEDERAKATSIVHLSAHLAREDAGVPEPPAATRSLC